MGQNSWARIPTGQREQLRMAVFERDGWRCQIRDPGCTGYAEELDHIIPRRNGGALLDPANCRAACEPCNRGRSPVNRSVGAPTVGPAREW